MTGTAWSAAAFGSCFISDRNSTSSRAPTPRVRIGRRPSQAISGRATVA